MARADRRCIEEGCPRQPYGNKRRCGWHWVALQPADVQAKFARARLAQAPEGQYRKRVPAAECPDGARWCAGCQSFVPLFYTSGSRCRACASAASHAAGIEKRFGIDADEYARLLALQGGRCAICRARPRSKRLAVDHDHQTGAVRGLCCKRCNHDLLGAAHDDVELLRRAIADLEAPPSSGNWAPPPAEPAKMDEPPF